MRIAKRSSAIAAICLAAAIAAGSAETDSLSSLGWLAGAWRIQDGANLIEEQWTTPAGGLMLGMSRTLKNGKAVDFEFLRIEERNGSLYYIAQPRGRPATEFKLIESTAEEWIFENPQNPFPTRIAYKRNPDGSVTARLEGGTGEKRRVIAFPFKRAQ